MRTITALALGLLLLLSAPMAAQGGAEVTISSGRKGGNYYATASRLRAKLMEKEDVYVEVVESNGSLENLARLTQPDHPVNVALTQADALSRHLAENPEDVAKLESLTDLGLECVFIIAHAQGDVAGLADFRTPGKSISTGAVGSGASVTWNLMSELDPGLRATHVAAATVMAGLARIKARDPASDIAAVMLVQRPRMVNPEIQVLLDNPQDFRLVPVRPGDLETRSLPDGGSVYTFEKVKIRDLEVETLCTRGLITVSTEKLDEEARGKLAGILLRFQDYIVPKRK